MVCNIFISVEGYVGLQTYSKGRNKTHYFVYR